MGSHLKKEMRLNHYHGGDPLEWAKHLRILEHPDDLGLVAAGYKELPTATTANCHLQNNKHVTYKTK